MPVLGRATAAPRDWHLIHLGHLALSGAGLLILEATAVSPEGRISPADLGLYSRRQRGRAGARAGRHPRALADRRRDAARARRPQGLEPRAVGRRRADPPRRARRLEDRRAVGRAARATARTPPAALDAPGWQRVRDDFVARRAARRPPRPRRHRDPCARTATCCTSSCRRSPTSASDEYGGSLENRMRFPLEVFDAVRAAFPADKPVWVRISATDWVPGGWDIEGTVALSQALKARGCAAIHVSSGGVSPAAGDQARARLPGAVRAARQGRGRPADDRGRPDHRAGAGRSDHRATARPMRVAGARHAVRPALALARGGAARRQGVEPGGPHPVAALRMV